MRHGRSIVNAFPSRESFQLTNLVLSQGAFVLYQKSEPMGQGSEVLGKGKGPGVWHIICNPGTREGEARKL